MRELVLGGVPFTVDLAGKNGLTRGRLRSFIRAGTVKRLVRGTYVDARVPDDVVLRARALGLVVPPDSVVCRTTAAWFFGIPPLLINAHITGAALEVVRPAGSAAVRRPGTSGRIAMLKDAEVSTVHGVSVTTPIRTALDLARWLERKDGLAYLDAMLAAGLVTLESLAAWLPHFDGLPWIEQARELVSLADGGAESPGESWMRLRHLDAGFPRPALQVPLLDEAGYPRAYLDAGVLEKRVGLEYDGVEHHGPEHAAHDEARREWALRSHGWDILVFGKGDVLGRGHGFERAIGERLGIEPRIMPEEMRRRTYLHRRRRAA